MEGRSAEDCVMLLEELIQSNRKLAAENEKLRWEHEAARRNQTQVLQRIEQRLNEREAPGERTTTLLEEQHENFVAAVTKWEMLAATSAKWKWAAVKKKVNGNTRNISSIKRVTNRFLEVSRCSRAKQRQRNVQEECAARAKLLLLIRPIVVFHRFPALHAFAA